MEEEPSWCQPAELVLDHAVWSSPGKQIWLKNTTGVNVNTERTQIRSQKVQKEVLLISVHTKERWSKKQ